MLPISSWLIGEHSLTFDVNIQSAAKLRTLEWPIFFLVSTALKFKCIFDTAGRQSDLN